MTAQANSITLLRAKQLLVKQFTTDGTEIPHSQAKQHQFKTVVPRSWDDVLGVVRWMENDRMSCMVVGAPAEHTLDGGWYRRLKRDRGADAATCLPRDIQIIPFDVDGLELDVEGCGSAEEIARVVVDKVMADLGFPCSPTVVFQWSGSAGLKPGVRMRLLVWNELPVPLERLAELVKRVPYLDASIYEPHQPIYLGAPVFADERMDPFRGGVRSGLVEGESQTHITPSATLLSMPAHLAQYRVDGEGSLRVAGPAETGKPKDPALEALRGAGMVRRAGEPGKWIVRCPWAGEHSDPTQDEAAYFEAHYNGFERPNFVCLHSTCKKNGRDMAALDAWLLEAGLRVEVVDPNSSPRGPEHGGSGYQDVKRTKKEGVWVAAGLKSTERNVRRYLEHVGLRCRFNALTNDVEIHGWIRELVGERAVSWLIDAMQREGMPGAAATVTRAIGAIAQDGVYHPFDDWWAGLGQWDGVDRIAELAGTVTVENESWWLRALRIWLTQVAETSARPGVEPAELVLTFVGGQGIGKTRWFKSLLPGDFVRGSTYLDPTNKDSVINATSAVICELGELDAMLPGKSMHARNELFKSFMSQHIDRLRLPYGRGEVARPRRTVFGGSTNEREFLTDPTGARRFMPVVATRVDWDHGIDVRQLWAQVKAEHQAGAQWWMDDELQAWLRVYAQNFREFTAEYLETLSLLEGTGRPPIQVVGASHPPKGYVAVNPVIVAKILGLDAGRAGSRVHREIGRALRAWTGRDPLESCAGVRRAYIVPWTKAMNVVADVLRQHERYG